jgi:prepilin-type processing-associated H-X9-DG protein
MIDDGLAHEWPEAGHHDDDMGMDMNEEEGNPFDHNVEALSMMWSMDPTVVDDEWMVSEHAPHSGTAGGDRIFRLREGVGRFLITDINNPGSAVTSDSNIAILWDTIMSMAQHYNHIPGGSNVLYMDGHVEFKKFVGHNHFPMDDVGLSGQIQCLHTVAGFRGMNSVADWFYSC